jgi:predicted permease
VSRPPRLALWLLRLSRHGGRGEEIELDLGELFERRAAASGIAYARRRYWRDVLSFYGPRPRLRGAHASTSHQGAGPMSAFAFDLHQVLHAVRRRPGFFAVAALTLGVGFAAHFAAFAIVDRLVLSLPAHVASGERVFRLHIDRADVSGGRFTWFQTPYLAYQNLRQHARSFGAMAAYRTSRASVGTGADARMISMVYADEHYFPLLGVAAQRGRVFTADDNGAPSGRPVVVLSDAYWRSAFAAADDILGRTLRIGPDAFTVIGVAPPGFTGDTPDAVDAWAPLHAGARELPATWTTSPLFRSVMVLARVAEGTTPATAAAEAAAAYRRSSEGTPVADETARVYLASLSPGRGSQGQLTDQARIALWLEGVAVLVLLVAIANVVNLQMSRAAEQRREQAVRVAIGAGRWRLFSTLVLEMSTIAIGGTAVGALLTWWSAAALQRLLLPNAPPLSDPTRLAVVAALTFVATTAVVVAFAALQIRLDGIAERLRTGRGGDGFSRARLRQGLLVSQVVMSALLIVGAGLFLQSIVKLGRLQFGIDPDRVLTIALPLSAAGFSSAAAEDFYSRAIAGLSAVPGVEHVAAAHSTPFAPSQRVEIFVPGFERLPLETNNYPTFYTVTPAFFDTMGMRLLGGRGFTESDRLGAPPVIVVEAALAEALWPGQDALGKCLILVAGDRPCREIVGVVSNTRRFVGSASGALRYYVPMGQRVVNLPPQALLVRTTGEPAGMIGSVRAGLLGVEAGLPYAQIRVLRELAEPEMRPWRLGGTLFTLFGAAALFVATAGVYALLSVIVTQRTREIGVRLALGASPARARRMIVRQSLGWVVAGLAVGLAAALAVGRFIRPLLFDTSPYDAPVFAATAVLLLTVALMASMVPAFRASRIDPTTALKTE